MASVVDLIDSYLMRDLNLVFLLRLIKISFIKPINFEYFLTNCIFVVGLAAGQQILLQPRLQKCEKHDVMEQDQFIH